jgi:hypothetical protein
MPIDRDPEKNVQMPFLFRQSVRFVTADSEKSGSDVLIVTL